MPLPTRPSSIKLKVIMCVRCNDNNTDYYTLSVGTRAVNGSLMVNLPGRILPYSPLKFKAVFSAKMFGDLSPSVLNVLSK